MSMNLFHWLIEEISEHHGTTVIMFHRGESLLHPGIAKMLNYAKGKVSRIVLATNGMLLSGELGQTILNTVDFLSLSLDTKERFAATRIGGDYERIVRNMKSFLIDNQSRIETQVSMVRTDNVGDKDVREFISTWEGLVDRVRIYDEHSHDGKFGSVVKEKTIREPCSKVFTQTVVSWDGEIRRCNHDWNGNPLGNAIEDSIVDVWNGEAYKSLRKQHNSGQITDTVCVPCGSWYEGDEAGRGILVKRGVK